MFYTDSLFSNARWENKNYRIIDNRNFMSAAFNHPFFVFQATFKPLKCSLLRQSRVRLSVSYHQNNSILMNKTSEYNGKHTLKVSLFVK